MLMRMKENYYIKKCCGDFVLLKRRKNQEKCKKVLERVGVYGTLKETKEAIIKEMIKDEVNHRKKIIWSVVSLDSQEEHVFVGIFE